MITIELHGFPEGSEDNLAKAISRIEQLPLKLKEQISVASSSGITRNCIGSSVASVRVFYWRNKQLPVIVRILENWGYDGFYTEYIRISCCSSPK